MPSITNVNDLPQEVHKTFFDHFNPIERTLILSTCRRWYDLIMETRAWWREAEVEEDCSKEKMMRILQVFGQRSQGSLIKVQINRRIKTKEELQEVLSAIEPSIGSIKGLTLRQVPHLNTQTRTFARRLPQLQDLHALSTLMVSDGFIWQAGLGLRTLELGLLDDFQEQEEVEWLSQLETLTIINIPSKRSLWSLLYSCKASLSQLMLGQLLIQEDREFGSGKPIVMEALVHFHTLTSNPPESPLPLIAPALETLRCTISQAEATESPLVKSMTLVLESDDWEADQDFQEQSHQFAEKFKSVFQRKPEIRFLALEVTAFSNFELQTESLFQALLISDENKKEVVLPKLLGLHIRDFEEAVLDLQALAKVAIGREKYFVDQHFLKLRGSKIDVNTLDEECRNLIEPLFVVDLDPVNPILKDNMMEQYLKIKERLCARIRSG